MKHTITMSEEERQVFVKAFKRLLHLFSSAPAQETAPPPQGVKSDSTVITARIWKAEPGTTLKGAPCLRVQWGTQPAQPGHGREIHSATCFDQKWFPALTSAKNSGQPVKFVVVRRGDYLNIVSVAA